MPRTYTDDDIENIYQLVKGRLEHPSDLKVEEEKELARKALKQFDLFVLPELEAGFDGEQYEQENDALRDEMLAGPVELSDWEFYNALTVGAAVYPDVTIREGRVLYGPTPDDAAPAVV